VNPEAALDEAVDRFFADPKPHWRKRGFPFDAFREQWPDYVPPLEVTGPPAPPPPAWAGTEAGAMWLGVLNHLRETGRSYTAKNLMLCVVPVGLEASELVLQAVDANSGRWVTEMWAPLIEEVMAELHPKMGYRVEGATLRLVSAG
jgi:hypothetical protein